LIGRNLTNQTKKKHLESNRLASGESREAKTMEIFWSMECEECCAPEKEEEIALDSRRIGRFQKRRTPEAA
jgi:hypothetical protein